MAARKRILVIAHFCDYGNGNSNNRFNYLADLFCQQGYEVELVTSSFSHREKKQRQVIAESGQKYKTTLIYEPTYKKNISLKRLFISHRVMARNLKKYLSICAKPNVVYCAIPSIDVAEVATLYAKENGIRFVVDVQDLWPEAYRLIIKSDLFYRSITASMKRRIDHVYSAADQIIAVSETYADRAMKVNKKCKSAAVVYLGTEAEAFDCNVRNNAPIYKKASEEVWIGYCGTLGHSYDLSSIVRALGELMREGITNVRLIIMGSGPLEDAFRKEVDAQGVLTHFTGNLPYEVMCAQLNECDIAVNPIAKGAAQSIINKHADYAMAGLPVISTQDEGEYSKLLDSYKCGINCTAKNIFEIKQAICELVKNDKKRAEYARNSKKLGIEKFDRKRTYGNILKVLQG